MQKLYSKEAKAMLLFLCLGFDYLLEPQIRKGIGYWQSKSCMKKTFGFSPLKIFSSFLHFQSSPLKYNNYFLL